MNPIQMICCCGDKRCFSEVYISEDMIDEKPVFMVSVGDAEGGEEANAWLTPEQLYELGELCMAAARLVKEE